MLRLILIFLKIGFLGFGGGYAMLSLIFEDALRLGISVQDFANMNALDLIAPGPIAINSATFVGYTSFGVLGSILATLAVCVSSIVFSGLLLSYEEALMENEYIHKFLSLCKLAAIGLILSVSFSLLSDALFPSPNAKLSVVSLISIVFAALARFQWKLNPILTLCLCGGIGYVSYLFL